MLPPEGTISKIDTQPPRPKHFDIEALLGYILLIGVLLSMSLIVIGMAWRWARTGRLTFDYTIGGMNLFQFVLEDLRQVAGVAVGPRLMVNLGITVLLLTLYVRVLASMLYFAFAKRNCKYTLFTAFVLSVLTYSLFLR